MYNSYIIFWILPWEFFFTVEIQIFLNGNKIMQSHMGMIIHIEF